MQYYPLFIDLKGQPVLVVGAGNIAYEKVQNLLKAGAVLTLVAPWVHPSLERFSKRITFVRRCFEPSDISTRYRLVFGATGDSALNETISRLCLEQHILCNAVDDPKHCHFIVPSILRRGFLTVAISTSGVSPTLAIQLKQSLKKWIGPEYTMLTKWLATFRYKVIDRIASLEGRKRFWGRFYQKQPLTTLKEQGLTQLSKQAHHLLENVDSYD